jgi:hypothetical protein
VSVIDPYMSTPSVSVQASRRLTFARAMIAAAGAVLLGSTLVTNVPPQDRLDGERRMDCEQVALPRIGISFRGALATVVVKGGRDTADLQRNMGNGAAVGDYDGDGDLDLYLLAQAGHNNKLFANQLAETGVATFHDVTDLVGLSSVSGSRAAQFVDLDLDGRLDLVVVNDYIPGAGLQPSRLFRSTASGFDDVTAGSGFDPVGLLVGGMGIADYNRDGLPDIYVAYWSGGMGFQEMTFTGHNRLYKNLGRFRFQDVTEEAGLGRMRTGSFTPVFTDLTGDNWPDLYISVDGAPDRLYVNEHGVFYDRTRRSGLGDVRNSMGVAVLDEIETGLKSLFVTNISDPLRRLGFGAGGNAFLRPSRTGSGHLQYRNVAPAYGVERTGWGWGAVFVDFNLDTYPDLFVAQGMDWVTREISPPLLDDRSYVFAGTDSGWEGIREGTCAVPGDQRTLLAFDYDRDGRPDLLFTQVTYEPILLRNVTRTANGGLTIILDPAPGEAVIGARVIVEAESRIQAQTVVGGGSYLAGPPHELYFGLGSAQTATVRVHWPDGLDTELVNVEVNQVLRIKRTQTFERK